MIKNKLNCKNNQAITRFVAPLGLNSIPLNEKPVELIDNQVLPH